MTQVFVRGRSARTPHGFTYVELLVVLVLIVLGIALLLPTTTRTNCGSNRTKCASNLRQIGQAMLLYSNDSHGGYPHTRVSAEPVRTPTFGTGVAATQPFDPDGPADNDVTAAMFMLLRTQDITAEVFTCPSTNTERDDYGGGTNAPINRSNFTDFKKNLSYSFQNPYADQSAIEKGWKFNNTLGAEYAIAADLNPGTAGNGDNVLVMTTTSSAADMKSSNSNNHEKDGQNILYGDGHVSWESNPFVGVNRDNIYTTSDGKVNASPVDANDSILLPTDD